MASKKEIFTNETVRDYLLSFVGEPGYKAARALPSTRAKSEYEIADDTHININQLRSILYKFYSKNLVNYHRIRDANKGWYIYHWKFFPEKLIETILREKESVLSEIEEKQEQNSDVQYYACPSCAEKYPFEEAFNMNFMCENCRSTLNLLEKKKSGVSRSILNTLKREIRELKKLAS
ncbi:hypothetical protein COT72_04815 [archaeon CG10_big_fil_rev_8_21_14_0_10_43_11]|nr:MAG: hypothetical protein COT72_04815 [archaeon CG10_big_fil_rev_8_21_14_0_10_43_11]